jgi:membrane-bound lytic murein transglycosylase B
MAVMASLAFWQAPSAGADPVGSSPRPQQRPAAASSDSQAVSRAAQSLTATPLVLATSVRPVLRPGTLGTAPERTSPERVMPTAAKDQAFHQWIAGFRGRAMAAGINGAVFDRAFRNVSYDAEVVKLDRNQSEFTKQIWDYLDSAVSDTRIANGRKALRQHARTLERIEAHFGVDKEVVAAIWGMESAYGASRGKRPLIGSLATLAYDGRRGSFFEKQLIAALSIVQSGDVPPEQMTGSWAGAMGHTQFIPTSYLAFAVDFTGDGRRDIWSDDPTDALASTAAYLRKSGWKKGQPWGVEVRLPAGFNPARATRGTRQMPSAWAAEGVTDMAGRAVPNYGNASILLPAGTQGAAFMIFDNFAAIEKYNKADAYVIGVGHLSDRIKGGPAIQASWPRQYQSTTFRQKKEIQQHLQRQGFGVSAVDGVIGPNTIAAIRAYQKSQGMTPDGYPSLQLLQSLQRR